MSNKLTLRKLVVLRKALSYLRSNLDDANEAFWDIPRRDDIQPEEVEQVEAMLDEFMSGEEKMNNE